MKNESLILMAALAIMSASCSNDEVVEKNADVRGSAITFAPRVEHSTKATEMSLTNLGNFGVIARSIDKNGNFYDAYLIGSEGADKVITPEIAKQDENEGKWKLDRNVYWPSGIQDVAFWAATTLVKPTTGTETRTDPLDGNGKLKWGEKGPVIADFSPRRSENRNAAYRDGDAQQDLVVAFTSMLQSSHNKYDIPMDFSHILSQIDIKAQEGGGQNSLNRRVRVKGAWIVNVNSKNSLQSEVDASVMTAVSETHKWADTGTPTWSAYGSFFNDYIELTNTPQSILKSSMMLLPQHNGAWDGTSTATTGSYILLLCRVCLVHEGEVHEGDQGGSIVTETDPVTKKTYHYHQVFPVSDTYNIEEYGYTCVPVEINWKAGKRYTYTLNMCGASSGAGWYPPNFPTENDFPSNPDDPNNKWIINRPTDKKPGDLVLDMPIQFNVTVSDWDKNEEWHKGNDAKPTM